MIYLSKLLDSGATGWLTCLRSREVTANLMKENLTLGQDLILTAPHDVVEALSQGASECWLSNDYPRVWFEKPTTVNSATLLPDDPGAHP